MKKTTKKEVKKTDIFEDEKYYYDPDKKFAIKKEKVVGFQIFEIRNNLPESEKITGYAVGVIFPGGGGPITREDLTKTQANAVFKKLTK